MTIRERFDAKNFAVVKYAKNNELSQPILSRILNDDETVHGKGKNGKGVSRKIFMQLKTDGIWLGALPWED